MSLGLRLRSQKIFLFLLAFGVRTVNSMTHFTDNGYRRAQKPSKKILRHLPEEFSLTQFFIFLPGENRNY